MKFSKQSIKYQSNFSHTVKCTSNRCVLMFMICMDAVYNMHGLWKMYEKGDVTCAEVESFYTKDKKVPAHIKILLYYWAIERA